MSRLKNLWASHALNFGHAAWIKILHDHTLDSLEYTRSDWITFKISFNLVAQDTRAPVMFGVECAGIQGNTESRELRPVVLASPDQALYYICELLIAKLKTAQP